MQKTKTIVCILTVLCLVMSIVSCGKKELEFSSGPVSICVGNSSTFVFRETKNDTVVKDLVYASADPTVMTVDQNGVAYAVGPGTTTIYVQSKSDSSLKYAHNVKCYYAVDDERSPVHDSNREKTTSTNFEFWNRNDYTERVGNWNVLAIAKIIISKSAGDYVFTDVYHKASMKDEVMFLLSDWGNSDVVYDKITIGEIDLINLFEDRMNFDITNVDSVGLENAVMEISEYIAKIEKATQNEVYFSRLPSDREYRAYLKINCSIYETVNFYSRGTLKGLASLGFDIFSSDFSSFLDSYTYTKTIYELELDGCEFVVESRPKTITE